MEKSTIRLSDLCDLVSQQVNPHHQPEETVYVGLEHVATGHFVRMGNGKASDVQSSKCVFRPDDILYGKLRPYLDKAVLVQEEGICSTDLIVLRHKKGVDPRFLIGVIHSKNFLEYAVAGTTGVQHPRTSWSHIREFSIPEFTLDEQKRIAKISWLVYKGITTSEALIKAGSDLKRATMQKLFTCGLRAEPQKQTETGSVPESWAVASVAKAVKPLRFGAGVKVPKSDYSETGRWPIIDQGQEFIAGYTDDESRVIHHEVPVIVFGDHTRIFKFVDFSFTLGADGTKPLLATDGFVPKYLYYALCNLKIQSRGYNRHYTVLKEMLVGKPSVGEQHEMVAILDAIDRKIDLHRKKRAVLDDLFKTLLHQLMTGKIHTADLNIQL